MLLIGVPSIRQEKSMSCWHAAARMLYGYKRRACIDPLPGTYSANTGLSASKFVQLAKSVGLRTIPQVNMTHNWTFIDNLLRRYGPVWAAGRWNGVPHVIVITGVDESGRLYFNHPANGFMHIRDMGWFNTRIATEVAIPMMYLP